MPKEPEYFPITTAQKLLVMSYQYSLKKHCVNIPALIHFDCEMDLSLLTQAVTLAVMRNETCRLRLHKQGKEVVQYLSDEAPAQIPVLDYSDLTEEEMTKILDKWSQTPFPNGSMDTPLYVVKLYRRPGGYYSMFLCANHMGFDAYTIVYIASEVHTIYGALRDGTAIPPVKSDYRKLCQQDFDYLTSPRRQADLDFWTEVLTPEPYACTPEPSMYKRKNGSRWARRKSIFSDKGYQLNFTMKRELAEKVNAAAAERRISPQCYYLLAARSYLSMMEGDQNDVLLQNAVSRRATLLQKHSGGTLAGAVPFRMNMDNAATTVADGLRQIHTLQKQYLAHTDFNVVEVMNTLQDKYGVPMIASGYDHVLLTFSPYQATRPEGVHSHLATHSNGTSFLALYLNIMALDESGDLNFNFEYLKVSATPETCERMFNHMMKALEAMVENPSMTLLELNHL